MRRASEKIVSSERATEIVEGWRGSGLRVAWAHGGFDLLDAAQVRSLSALRRGADRVAVEVASDRSVQPAPVLGEAERVLLAASLRVVDLVTIVPKPSVSAVVVDAEVALPSRVRERHASR